MAWYLKRCKKHSLLTMHARPHLCGKCFSFVQNVALNHLYLAQITADKFDLTLLAQCRALSLNKTNTEVPPACNDHS